MRVAVIGLGLIGSSVCRAARRAGMVPIMGYDASAEVMRRARGLALADSWASDAAEAAGWADIVVVATPVGAYAGLAAAIGTALSAGSLLMDVGSVKAPAMAAFASAAFVSAHPMAGTEYSGPEAGVADLFDNRWCALTQPAGGSPAVLARAEAFWQACGARVATIDAQTHDRVLAFASHMPHLIAWSLTLAAAEGARAPLDEVIRFSGGGFRDFTRIAASDPIMWRDIFLANREETLASLDAFADRLATLRGLVRDADGAGLAQAFAKARQVRARLVEAGEDTASPDFGRRAAAPLAASLALSKGEEGAE